MRAGPRRAPVVVLMASVLLGACAPPGPVASLEPPADLSPGPSETYLALGNRLLAGGESALAMRAYSTSLGTEGVSVEALTGSGIAAREQGMLHRARRYFEHARDLAPGSANVHYNLGVVLLALNEYDAARSAFRTALALSGGDDAHIRHGLERAEAALAAGNGATGRAVPARRVVRLGKDEFRLTAQPEAEEELRSADEAE